MRSTKGLSDTDVQKWLPHDAGSEGLEVRFDVGQFGHGRCDLSIAGTNWDYTPPMIRRLLPAAAVTSVVVSLLLI